MGFADAKHPFILSLKDIIGPNHGTPDEVLDDASIVIAYYVPYTKELADTNKTPACKAAQCGSQPLYVQIGLVPQIAAKEKTDDHQNKTYHLKTGDCLTIIKNAEQGWNQHA